MLGVSWFRAERWRYLWLASMQDNTPPHLGRSSNGSAKFKLKRGITLILIGKNLNFIETMVQILSLSLKK